MPDNSIAPDPALSTLAALVGVALICWPQIASAWRWYRHATAQRRAQRALDRARPHA